MTPTKAKPRAKKRATKKVAEGAKTTTAKKTGVGVKNVSAYYAAVGRRKSSVARVRLSVGKGTITVNGKTLEQYFPGAVWQSKVTSPLALVGQLKVLDVSILANGGGVTGQAEASRHGISRALEKVDPTFRSTLKKAGFLTRDPREKERKKYGLKRARRAPQFSKR
jgi:small subunit ribosomal protein S9